MVDGYRIKQRKTVFSAKVFLKDIRCAWTCTIIKARLAQRSINSDKMSPNKLRINKCSLFENKVMESQGTTSLQPKTWQKLIEGHKAGLNKQRRIMSPRQAHLGLHTPSLCTNVIAVNFMEYFLKFTWKNIEHREIPKMFSIKIPCAICPLKEWVQQILNNLNSGVLF